MVLIQYFYCLILRESSSSHTPTHISLFFFISTNVFIASIFVLHRHKRIFICFMYYFDSRKSDWLPFAKISIHDVKSVNKIRYNEKSNHQARIFFLWNHKQYADLTCKIWFYGDNIRWLVDNRAKESMKRLDFYLLYDIYHMWREKICWLNQILRNKSTKKTYVFITFDIYMWIIHGDQIVRMKFF